VQIKPLFATPLVTANLGRDSRMLANLRETILAREGNDPGGIQHSNDGGWQSNDDFIAWAGAAGSALVDGITDMVNRLTTIVEGGKLEKRPLPWRVNAWANVNRKGNGNMPHYHPGAVWSAVVYVDDGGINGGQTMGGCLELSDPRGALPIMYAPTVKVDAPGFLSAGLAERVWPETGLIVLFPSWLLHSVAPYHGDSIRISIAMNFAL
jgi:uncharacterized protein (TIGR02466 family)